VAELEIVVIAFWLADAVLILARPAKLWPSQSCKINMVRMACRAGASSSQGNQCRAVIRTAATSTTLGYLYREDFCGWSACRLRRHRDTGSRSV
jgi:hypothetical protein